MAFNNPNILQLGSRIPQTPKTYTRPSDWISITGVSSGQIIFLVSDAINTKYSITFTKTGAGNVYVDWGDSTSDTYAASSTAVHTYTSGGTACSRGYNTWKITMTLLTHISIVDFLCWSMLNYLKHQLPHQLVYNQHFKTVIHWEE